MNHDEAIIIYQQAIKWNHRYLLKPGQMAKAGQGWPELTKTPALAGIIIRPGWPELDLQKLGLGRKSTQQAVKI